MPNRGFSNKNLKNARSKLRSSHPPPASAPPHNNNVKVMNAYNSGAHIHKYAPRGGATKRKRRSTRGRR